MASASTKSTGAAKPKTRIEARLRIGIIADTHGYLSPAIPRLLKGVDHIIHAGDVGKRSVPTSLAKVAPVTAIAGNADRGKLAASLPAHALGNVGGVRFLIVHKPKAIKRHVAAARRAGVDLIVAGHLHEASFFWEETGELYVNPGTATAPDDGDTVASIAIVSLIDEGLAVAFIPVPRAKHLLAKHEPPTKKSGSLTHAATLAELRQRSTGSPRRYP